MAFNYPMPNRCPVCANYQPPNPQQAQCHCQYHSQCYCCPHHQMQPAERQMQQGSARPPPNRRTKLTRSRSAHGMGMDVCGDIIAAKGACACYDRNTARAARQHSPFKCCSSSGKPLRHGTQERGRRQPQPRYVPAPPCDINRLMSMVRDPHRYDSEDCCTDTATDEEDDDDEDEEEEETAEGTTSTLPQLPPANSEFSDSELPLEAEELNERPETVTMMDKKSHQLPRPRPPDRFHNTKTRVKFTPPASCIMLVKKADQQRLVKTDRQVQCCFDISSDFCSCSKAVCEFCAKKIVCTCPRIRCCMCAKLKSTADRKLLAIFVCRCPKTYRCCRMGSSFLRFNSSPTLAARGSFMECATTTGGRPFTF